MNVAEEYGAFCIAKEGRPLQTTAPRKESDECSILQ